jgi:hypothetical protein
MKQRYRNLAKLPHLRQLPEPGVIASYEANGTRVDAKDQITLVLNLDSNNVLRRLKPSGASDARDPQSFIVRHSDIRRGRVHAHTDGPGHRTAICDHPHCGMCVAGHWHSAFLGRIAASEWLECGTIARRQDHRHSEAGCASRSAPINRCLKHALISSNCESKRFNLPVCFPTTRC